MTAPETGREKAFAIISEQRDEAIAAPKCHQCGCLQGTVEALAATAAGRDNALASKLAEAHAVFKPKMRCHGNTQYDQLSMFR